MTNVDIATYGGLIIAVPLIVGTIKQLAKSWAKGKSATMTAVLMVGLGVTAKLTGIGFESVEWVIHVVTLVLSVPLAMVARDKAKNVVEENTGGGA